MRTELKEIKNTTKVFKPCVLTIEINDATEALVLLAVLNSNIVNIRAQFELMRESWNPQGYVVDAVKADRLCSNWSFDLWGRIRSLLA